jgi:hypothetical protein
MVLCRTIQDQKTCARRQDKLALDRARCGGCGAFSTRIICHVHLYIYIDMAVSHYLKLVYHKKYCVKGRYRSYNLFPWRCPYSSRIYILGVRSWWYYCPWKSLFLDKQNCHSQKRKKYSTLRLRSGLALGELASRYASTMVNTWEPNSGSVFTNPNLNPWF